MIPDQHTHTCFSHDSEATPESMIERAIELAMSAICFTEHYDYDIPYQQPNVNTDAYVAKISNLQEQYKDKIAVRIGVELNMQPHLVEHHHKYLAKYPFDFVIGSSHLVYGEDPYHRTVFKCREDRDVYRAYFEELLENVKVFSEFDVVGHIDYIVRYGTHQNEQYSYLEYADVIDEILKMAVTKGRGIEVNTSGFRSGLGGPNPHVDVIKRYKELGGEIITLGSDAHRPGFVGYKFEEMIGLLKDIGFKYIAQFCKREPDFIEI